MDWATLLAAAVLSGAVSWATARHVATRQHRAMVGEDAREELRTFLAPVRLQVEQYDAGIRHGRKATQAHTEDAALAGRVLEVAERLPWWRRRLVRRRLSRLVGPAWMTTAELHTPGNEMAAFTTHLAQQLEAIRRERSGEEVERTADLGLLHRAMTEPRDPAAVAELRKELSRLASGW